MSKTPFELRFDALELARGYLVEEYYSRVNWKQYLAEHPQPGMHLYSDPIFPTANEILTLAAQFKAFVDDKPILEDALVDKVKETLNKMGSLVQTPETVSVVEGDRTLVDKLRKINPNINETVTRHDQWGDLPLQDPKVLGEEPESVSSMVDRLEVLRDYAQEVEDNTLSANSGVTIIAHSVKVVEK